MQQLHDRWAEYEREMVAPDTTDTQRLQLRRAYYVGAAVGLELMYKAFLGSYPRT